MPTNKPKAEKIAPSKTATQIGKLRHNTTESNDQANAHGISNTTMSDRDIQMPCARPAYNAKMTTAWQIKTAIQIHHKGDLHLLTVE
jgi:hypothetical protein